VLLEGKNAVVYGGGGAIGGAVARVFAREGARVDALQEAVAAFVASDRARTMTAATVNLSCGALIDY
jgi:NAD(P)-dependent dehydrogenase (short-subunit alcohol dehydrogenase family)